MTRSLTTLALLPALLFAGCRAEEPPLPEDVYEDGWDETTRTQRVGLLRSDLSDQLEILRATAPGTQPHQAAIEGATRALSALRPELTSTEQGKVEYRALETQVEALTGDAN